MKFTFLLYLFFVSINSRAQQNDLSEAKFIGKWLWCSGATDSADTDCSKSLDTLEFKANNNFVGGRYYIYPQWYQYTGNWTLDKDKRIIVVTYHSTKNMKRSNNLFLDIHFVDNNLFFTRSVSTVENPGTMFYSYYRRI